MKTRSLGEARASAPDWLALECYTEDEVLDGRIRWPVGLRLLDLLNSLYTTQHDSSGDFLDFIDVTREGESARTFVNKSAIQMVTVAENDLARGAGADSRPSYPFVQKSEISVSLRLRTHVVGGTMHLADLEDVQDLLNRDALFLPVTNATLATVENQFYGKRPFVAVNKRHIAWIRVT
jgi:hypothetical protein